MGPFQVGPMVTPPLGHPPYLQTFEGATPDPSPGGPWRSASHPHRAHCSLWGLPKAPPTPRDAFCRHPPHGPALLREKREKGVSAVREAVGRREGRLVPHDRIQGGEGGSALGFCEGKALYPPVLTPRSTARLREGICEGKIHMK